MPVRTLPRYSDALHGLDLSTSRIELLDLRADGPRQFVARWRLEGALKLPWRPKVKPWPAARGTSSTASSAGTPRAGRSPLPTPSARRCSPTPSASCPSPARRPRRPPTRCAPRSPRRPTTRAPPACQRRRPRVRSYLREFSRLALGEGHPREEARPDAADDRAGRRPATRHEAVGDDGDRRQKSEPVFHAGGTRHNRLAHRLRAQQRQRANEVERKTGATKMRATTFCAIGRTTRRIRSRPYSSVWLIGAIRPPTAATRSPPPVAPRARLDVLARDVAGDVRARDGANRPRIRARREHRRCADIAHAACRCEELRATR